MFVVTDILQSDSVAIVQGRVAQAVERAYGVELVDNRVLLKGVVSRKQQIVPIMTQTLASFSCVWSKGDQESSAQRRWLSWTLCFIQLRTPI